MDGTWQKTGRCCKGPTTIFIRLPLKRKGRRKSWALPGQRLHICQDWEVSLGTNITCMPRTVTSTEQCSFMYLNRFLARPSISNAELNRELNLQSCCPSTRVRVRGTAARCGEARQTLLDPNRVRLGPKVELKPPDFLKTALKWYLCSHLD